MKILEVESIYGGEIKIVKTRKDFVCKCCEELKPKGTMAKSFKCANSNDFFELKFCLDCDGKYFIQTN
jgi:hypothetical protein